MWRRSTWGPRAAVILAVVLAATAVGILTPTLSNTVEKDVRVDGSAITLTVEGVPDVVSPGDLFRVKATLTNNANRPVPAVLRMQVRNPNSTTAQEVTVYAGCGSEEVISSRTLLYYIGWNGPLLAPKGTSFPAGTSLAALESSVGGADYWAAVLHEVQERDPLGYGSLIDPGANATGGVRNSASVVLKVLSYFGMVSTSSVESTNLADWSLAMPFSDRIVADDSDQDGFLMEIHPQSRGSFELKFWAERPDGFGMPNHPSYRCGPL